MLKKRFIDSLTALVKRISAYSPLTKVAILMILASLIISVGYGIRILIDKGQIAEITDLPITPPVTPPPTSDPSLSIACTPVLYKQPFNINNFPSDHGFISSYYFLPEYEVNLNPVVTVGDVYAHGIKITNTSNQYLSTSEGSGFYMQASAINKSVDFQFIIQQAAYCNSSYLGSGSLDYVRCPAEPLSLAPGETKVLAMPYFVTRIDGNTPSLYTTGYQFDYTNSSGYVYKSCGADTMTRGLLSPGPSSLPSPSPSQSPICTRQSPLISIGPGNHNGQPGETLTYAVGITNMDTQPCGSSQFSFSTLAPEGFSTNQPMYSAPIPAGATYNTTFTVTSPLANPWNEERTVPVSFAATNMQTNLSSSINAAYTLLMPSPQTIYMTFKLAGVSNNAAEGSQVNVKFYLKNGTVLSLSEPLTLSHTQGGIYTTSATISNPFSGGTQYRVKVKGEKHLSVEFCHATGQTSPCGDNDYITMPSSFEGNYGLSFIGIPLPPGDLSPQDGRANIDDLNKLKPLMGKSQSSLTDADLLVGDANYDHFINIFDVFLILKTLETRYDD